LRDRRLLADDGRAEAHLVAMPHFASSLESLALNITEFIGAKRNRWLTGSTLEICVRARLSAMKYRGRLQGDDRNVIGA
jgi:hypothetical protein